MAYDYSLNISVDVIERMLEFAKENNTDVIAIHMTNDPILEGIHVSLSGDGWFDKDNHVDITDYDRA